MVLKGSYQGKIRLQIRKHKEEEKMRKHSYAETRTLHLLDIDYKALGNRIKALRLAQNRTQAILATELHLAASYYGHIERGTRKCSLETLYHISQALAASMDYLITGTEKALTNAEYSSYSPAEAQIMSCLIHLLIDHKPEWLDFTENE